VQLLFYNTEISEVRGIEISANHLKAKRNGIVTATARIVHQGKASIYGKYGLQMKMKI
jgi:acyl-coenzyme A thioesterase PaaI-like protein